MFSGSVERYRWNETGYHNFVGSQTQLLADFLYNSCTETFHKCHKKTPAMEFFLSSCRFESKQFLPKHLCEYTFEEVWGKWILFQIYDGILIKFWTDAFNWKVLFWNQWISKKSGFVNYLECVWNTVIISEKVAFENMYFFTSNFIDTKWSWSPHI